jgi:hypothetical protein
MKNAMRLLGLWASAATLLFGHEESTHQRISDAAVVYLNAAYLSATPARPLLLGSVALLQQKLEIGAVQEDDAAPKYRSLFHFTPALDNFIQVNGNQGYVSANGCSSVNWGQNIGGTNGAIGCSASLCSVPFGFASILPNFCGSLPTSGSLTNSFRWDQDLAVDNTGAPSVTSVTGVGYVIHLLEDLGSPPHTRNDAHPCFLNYCDQFETFNNNSKYAPFGDPQQLPGNVWTNFLASTLSTPGVITQVISTAVFTTPTDFFNALQQYVSTNYYSNRTVFQGSGPTSRFSDGNYFYGSCITSGVAVSQIAGTCLPVVNPADSITYLVRKIAHKTQLYWLSCPNPVNAVLGLSSEAGCDVTKADIDQTIAREQFAELGPVIAQHVAAFIQFYAPAVNVTLQGSGSGTVTSTPGNLNCASGTCPALFVQGSTVFLTATQAAGSAFAGWGGACASAGTNTIAQLTLTSDVACTASFTSGCAAQTLCGTVTNYLTGTVDLSGIYIALYSSQGSLLRQTYTDSTGKYSFSDLTAPNYILFCEGPLGTSCQPTQSNVTPGQQVDFKVLFYPGSVTIPGPSGAFVLFSYNSYTGPPPCVGGGCPQQIAINEGTAPSTFSIPERSSFWLTCYLPPTYAQTSSVQLSILAKQSITMSCPP